MKKGELQLNKWHFKLGIIPVYYRNNGYLAHFGIFKLIGFLLEGETIQKQHYKGFWLRKEINWQGFEISL